MIAKFILSIYVALIAFEEISLLNVVAIKSTSTLMRDVNRNRKNTVSSVDFRANSKHILNTVATSSSTTKAKNDDFFTFEDLQNNVVATSSIKLLVDQIYRNSHFHLEGPRKHAHRISGTVRRQAGGDQTGAAGI